MNFFDTPRLLTTWALFYLLREGDEVPDVRDAAYGEVYKRHGQFRYFGRILGLAKTWGNPAARFVGIQMLNDIQEHSDNPRLLVKAKRALQQLAKYEKDPRNKALIENMLKKGPETGQQIRLASASTARRAAKAVAKLTANKSSN